MASDGYYGGQPQFPRRDPLTVWAVTFLIVALVATLWLFLLLFLMSEEMLESRDSAFGLSQDAWVAVTAVVLVISILGLFFVIVARLGGGRGGGYLSADLDLEQERAAVGAATAPPAPPVEPAATQTAAERAQSAARIDDPFGPDGRMLLSYTTPEQQPRGLYGDTWVPVDSDAVLNVRTLLARTASQNQRRA